ncbi:hypothetical protein [Streptomyces griseocarneus]|uniref:hypothetical protein n=1 Tax=Streptomyces griseocarneus TaxID=51201 RepID=UPI00167EA845|nr:hypothetical protein [Streptomyces griseocarneus]MBZ6475402.1 hypothetical protein [Streptomyces griseocarneus]GHG75087.1 hypothetical protein GCM10018779_52320 [Streptomyces griseocarneus]
MSKSVRAHAGRRAQASGDHIKGLPHRLRLGARVIDIAKGREGIAHGVGEPFGVEEKPSYVWLLPPSGGFEWRVDVTSVRPLGNDT